MLQAEIRTAQGLAEVLEFRLDRSNGWPRERRDECGGAGRGIGRFVPETKGSDFYEFYEIKIDEQRVC